MDSHGVFFGGVQHSQPNMRTHQVVQNCRVPDPLYLCFVDLSRTHDSVDHTALVIILRSYDDMRYYKQVNIIQELYTGTGCKARTADTGNVLDDFQVKMGEVGLCVVSTVVDCVMDRILRQVTQMC